LKWQIANTLGHREDNKSQDHPAAVKAFVRKFVEKSMSFRGRGRDADTAACEEVEEVRKKDAGVSMFEKSSQLWSKCLLLAMTVTIAAELQPISYGVIGEAWTRFKSLLKGPSPMTNH
jgi:hypothetical protein